MKKHLEKKYNLKSMGDFSNSDIKGVSQALQGFEDILDDFGVEDVFNSFQVDTNGKGEEGSYGWGIFSIQPIKNADYVNQRNKKYYEMGDSSTNNIYGLGAHEGAHAIEYYLALRNKTYGSKSNSDIAYLKGKESTSIINEAVKRAKKKEYGKGKDTSELIHSLSSYATTKRQEAFAEALANYKTFGKKANPFAIEVAQVTKERIKLYKNK